MTPDTPTVADRIRAAIAPAHVAVEQTAFARGMTQGTLTRAAYCDGLRQLLALHESLEAALAAADSPLVASVYDADRMTRASIAARDLDALGHPADVADPVAPAIAELAGRFAEWVARPAALIGALYVLEGSKMGSMILAKSLGRCLDVNRGEVGLDYHLDGVAGRGADWKRFRAAVAELPLSEAGQADAVAGATQTMDALVATYAAVPARAAQFVTL